MPTNKFESLEDVYKALTDFEIEDDSTIDGVPVAIINVPGLHRIRVIQVSDWDYFKYIVPMRANMLALYAQSIVINSTEEELKGASQKVKKMVEEFTGLKPDELKSKIDIVEYFFHDEQIRYEFFKGLKRMKMLKWWVTWKKWCKTIKPHHRFALFILLWAFNFDGLKKKTTRLLKICHTILANTNSQSLTGSNSSTSFDTWKKDFTAAHARLATKSQNN